MSVISSARTASPALISWASGSSVSAVSCPSARRMVRLSSSSSGDWSALRRPSTMRSASRLKDVGLPVWAWKTTTPTGDVSISVSRSTLARRSSRSLRALEMTSADCEANITSISSSSALNSSPGSLLAKQIWPTLAPRWRMGAASRELTGIGGRNSGSPTERTWAAKSATRNGSGTALRYSKNRSPPGISHRR